jgi:hypothetical protein
MSVDRYESALIGKLSRLIIGWLYTSEFGSRPRDAAGIDSVCTSIWFHCVRFFCSAKSCDSAVLRRDFTMAEQGSQSFMVRHNIG